MGLAHTLFRRVLRATNSERDYAYGRQLIAEARPIIEASGDVIMEGWMHYMLGNIVRFGEHDLHKAVQRL